jgi:glycosyltransferase involved in cell wall biosynthesis
MIPTYNCFGYVEETLKSVLSQDLGKEIMQIQIVDDCSTDGDVEGLVNKIGQGRVEFNKQCVNQGSLRNFETCINHARGHYIHILHGDDRVEPGFYKEISDLFALHPEAGAAFTNFIFIDYKSQKVDLINRPLLSKPGIISDFLSLIGKRQELQPPAMVVKRKVYEELGSFYAVHFGEDWEMWARIASKFQVAYSPNYLAAYRLGHGTGISHNYFLTGQNIPDIKKVIDIIQTYLPEEKRARYKRSASAYYATYCVRTANSLLSVNKNAALIQTKGAWKMSKDLETSFWALRFYMMYILGYKKFIKKMQSIKKGLPKSFSKDKY